MERERGMTGLHMPYCNIRCAGEAHWLGEVGPIDIHAHGKRQVAFCGACAERETA